MLFELAQIFLRLGATSFGGPLAHIALMRSELVEKRGWLSEQDFLDLNGAVNLIPGPNSTELAMHIGHQRAGNAGLWVAGACFITPAMILVLILAAFYAKFGTLPQSRAILWGVSPIVVAIVGQALLKFAPSALKNHFAQLIAVAALVGALLGVGEVKLILAAALVGLFAGASSHQKASIPLGSWILLPASVGTTVVGTIFWPFLKIGSVIYGSGFVLLAYLRAEFVENLHLISDRQLLDAVAVGQITPGPVFTTATFIGYQIGGFWGVLAATAGIFLPSFVAVMLLARFMAHLSGSPRARLFLDAVNAASFALMVLVTLQLARVTFWPAAHPDSGAMAIGLVAAFLLGKTRFNAAFWLVLGALFGLLCGPR